jgi:alpha-mannosidase
MQAAPDHILARAERTLRDRVYAAAYLGWHKLDLAIAAPTTDPVPFEQAKAATYEPAVGGTRWGAPWTTTWFRLTGTTPEDWPAEEVDVDLGWTWGPNTGEALIFDASGRAVEALSPGRPRIPWRTRTLDLYIEAAANPMPTFDWYPTDSSLGPMPDAAPRMTVSRAQLVRVNRTAEKAANDLVLAIALTKEQADPARGLAALWKACDLIDDLSTTDPWAQVVDVLKPVFETRNAPSAPRLHAVANAHIDTAWLWPFRETIRKVARSFANALAVMDDDPHVVFASSQVQHLAWMQERYPDLFDRIRSRVHEGRWLVEGGTWVEPDGNMPSGESFTRQFLYGQTWLQEHLGMTATTFWLPDTFGYSAGLPQIARGAGCDTFITQKLSWNSLNVFPHTTLLWEGLDGSRLLTHFPPADDYGCSVLPAELTKAGAKMAKQEVVEGLFLYGFGDGGGGPTREMATRIETFKDTLGLPRIEHSTVAEFFEAARTPDPPVWSGELYLEYHRGTLTSQARIKQLHRRAEIVLREAEIWAVGAHLQQGLAYPGERLRELWRELLVMQFHDVLPGTSIGWVHDEACERLEAVIEAAEALVTTSLEALAGQGDEVLSVTASPHGQPGIPAFGSTIGVVAPLPDSDAVPGVQRITGRMQRVGPALRPSHPQPVTATQTGARIAVRNDRLSLEVAGGLVTSLVIDGRETVPPAGAIGRLRMHPDRPVRWDAWDLDEQHRSGAVEIPVVAAELMPDLSVEVTRSWRGSEFMQSFRLLEDCLEIRTSVDWHTQDVLLRMECDLDVLARATDAETMYGYVTRPITQNTSWDQAKFETCGHHWLHVGEAGFGIGLLTPTTYGAQITHQPRGDKGLFTRVAFSILRAPAFPDPRRDAGSHSFAHVIAPGASVADTVAAADRESFGVRTVTGHRFAPVVSAAGDGIVVEAVKLAEDGSGDVIVRMRETLGARSTGSVDAAAAIECDLIERPIGQVDPGCIPFGQFEVKTLRVTAAAIGR